MIPAGHQVRAIISRDRALLLAQMVRERTPEIVNTWLISEFGVEIPQEVRDLLIVQAALTPTTLDEVARLWSWTDTLKGRRLRLVLGRPTAIQRRQQIPRLRQQGWTQDQMAETFCCSRRAIEDDYKALRADGILPPVERRVSA